MLFHSLGLGALSTALSLQILVFGDILLHGYFSGVEGNPAILSFELFLTGFAIAYFVYLFRRVVFNR